MEPFAAGVKEQRALGFCCGAQRLASYTLLTRVIGGLAGGSVPLVNLRMDPSILSRREG
jgi:hypothetical protein